MFIHPRRATASTAKLKNINRHVTTSRVTSTAPVIGKMIALGSISVLHLAFRKGKTKNTPRLFDKRDFRCLPEQDPRTLRVSFRGSVSVRLGGRIEKGEPWKKSDSFSLPGP